MCAANDLQGHYCSMTFGILHNTCEVKLLYSVICCRVWIGTMGGAKWGHGMSPMWRIIKGPVYSMSRKSRTRESRPALKYFTAICALLTCRIEVVVARMIERHTLKCIIIPGRSMDIGPTSEPIWCQLISDIVRSIVRECVQVCSKWTSA